MIRSDSYKKCLAAAFLGQKNFAGGQIRVHGDGMGAFKIIDRQPKGFIDGRTLAQIFSDHQRDDLAAPFVLDQIDQGGRVLAVINNGGGRIFERIPRLRTMSPRAVECMSNPHAVDLSCLATLWGMRHLRVRRADDLDEFELGGKATLLEIIPDGNQTERFWADWDRTRE